MVYTKKDFLAIIDFINKNYGEIEDELAKPYLDNDLPIPDSFFNDAYEEVLERAFNSLKQPKLVTAELDCWLGEEALDRLASDLEWSVGSGSILSKDSFIEGYKLAIAHFNEFTSKEFIAKIIDTISYGGEVITGSYDSGNFKIKLI